MTTTLPTTTGSAARVLVRRELHSGWAVSAVGGPVPADVAGRSFPATVPGSVHTDLLAAGVIDDPYLDDNEALQRWIGLCDWQYQTTFAWSARSDGAADTREDRHELVLDGIDTVATITLNGTEVARTANMHRTYRLDVSALLRDARAGEGDNELVVTFRSPVRYADAQSLALGYRPQVNHHPFNAIRKMACSFGWDWGIDTATSGLWRPVALESWSTARLAAVRPVVTATAPHAGSDGRVGDGHLDVHVDLARASDADLTVTATVSGQGARQGGQVTATVTVAAGETSVVVPLDVPDAALWWPRGHGDQPLYDLRVELTAPQDDAPQPIDSWDARVGFRTVRLDVRPDEDGTSFTFLVNDRPVWVKGANWIPDDAFPHRVTRARYAARIAQAEAANMNLLRVWGGGIYEADDFYDLCDERGILVWQDFALACAAYSEDEPLWSEVEAEARDNVTRIMRHPSLALWNGSNENIWGITVWGFLPRLDGKSWGLGYYQDLLPSVVAELDPTRSYTPSSPWSGELPIDMSRDQNDPAHGSMHSWEMWNREDYLRYRDDVPRFMAEFGWQGPPSWSALTRAIHDDPITPESPGMRVHQKAMSGNDKLTDGLVRHLPLPDDTEDWHWAMQLNQANAVQVAVEHLRSHQPRNMGSVVWQLNDCWPVTSWAAVDGDGHPKPLLYALQHAHADRLLTVQPRTLSSGDRLAVVASNDTGTPWRGDVRVRRVRFDGHVLAETTLSLGAPARGVVTLPVPESVAAVTDAAAEVLVADVVTDVLGTVPAEGSAGGSSAVPRPRAALWFFAEARDAALEAPRLATSVTPVDGEGEAAGVVVDVTVTAENLVRDLTLLVDKVHPDAVADDALVTLLPGETVTFRVSAPAGTVLDAAALVSPRVLRSANDLVVRWAR
ncbi:glycoside hydrolase family 2 protein [Luteimicrobium subarcticum]|uniref:beta-mannosidase n=1 Tax=Luteimicrobium subarcticum TaxID=620910 RepID=A0A2M8WRX1_9MICO|nr:glycoside hydrolase family 2 protein [Luteimicrobium subarcticum]PJI93586.1 beta-mannosidase [Luteimicrobium subarcticum]